jgi:uncharacterized protein
MALLVVAALSARLLAEAAAREGGQVIALDLFGDQDTRHAALQWQPIGDGASMRIDRARLLDALRQAARRGDVQGWVPGSGFEADPELLAEAATLLPLIGTAADAAARVREPEAFFGGLAEHRIAHPDMRLGASELTDGWLVKDARGCGGWHIRRAGPGVGTLPSAHHYFQREVAGTPMSATFVANGRDACVLGFNRLRVRRFGARPFVFCGALGPLALPEQTAEAVRQAVHTVAASFRLRGLCSLDFMLVGHEQAQVLEVNPRPPASIGLYPHLPLLRAHLQACTHAALPQPQPAADHVVRGMQIVFAPHALQIDTARAGFIARWPGSHDRPCAGTHVAAGDPLCSLGAQGPDAGAVEAALVASHDALIRTLES